MLTQASLFDTQTALLGPAISGEERALKALDGLRKRDFTDPRYREIFEAIDTLKRSGTVVEGISIGNWLREKGKLDDVGGRKFLIELGDSWATAAASNFHAQILKDERIANALAEVPELIESGTDALVLARRIAELVEESKPLGVAPDEEKKPQFKYERIGDIAAEVIEDIQEHSLQPGTMRGIPCGFRLIDDATRGFRDGDLVILAARTGEGKTSIGMSMCMFPAMALGLTTALVSIEMSRQELIERYFAQTTVVPAATIATGNTSPHQINELHNAISNIRNTPLFIADQESGIKSLADIKAYCYWLDEKPRSLWVDHIGMVNPGNGETDPFRAQSIVADGLKDFAVEFRFPVIAMCQLSRPDKGKKIGKPTLYELRSSGHIENNAATVVFVHRPGYHDSAVDDDKAVLILAKNRRGPKPERDIKYDGPRFLFREYDEYGDLPKLYQPRQRATTEEAPQVEEEVIEQKEEIEEVKIPEYEKFEQDGEVYFRDLPTDEVTPRVWPQDVCEKKVREAIESGNSEKFWAAAAKFAADQSTPARGRWANACFDRLQEVYERMMTPPKPVDDDENFLAAFGF